MIEYWREMIVASFPLHLVIPVILILGGLFAFADYAYSAWQGSAASEVVHDVAEDVKTFSKVSWEDVQDKPIQVSTIRHMINNEPDRVLRI